MQSTHAASRASRPKVSQFITRALYVPLTSAVHSYAHVSSIRKSLVLLIPILAEYSRDVFARSYLDDSVVMLIKSVKVPDLRPAALVSLGRLCRASGIYLVSKVDLLTGVVDECFGASSQHNSVSASSNKKKVILPELMHCISDMVIGLGDAFHPYLLSTLEKLLEAGLSQQLIDTLTVVAAYVPDQRVGVQQRLLTEVTKVLGGDLVTIVPPPRYYERWLRRKTAQEEATVPSLAPPRHSVGFLEMVFSALRSILDSTSSTPSAQSQAQTTDLVLLSLRTLGTLSAPSKILLPMIQRSVLPYLDDRDDRVRQEAASTCAHMMLLSSSSGLLGRRRGPSAVAVEAIIARLLETAVADTSNTVRSTLLKRLSSDFDLLLCQAHHISTLMYLLSDEVFEIRDEALLIVSRLASIDPAEVLPSLRQILLNLIAEIRNSSDVRSREESVLLLCSFLRAQSLHRVVRVFMETIIYSLPFLTDVRLTTASLQALGELCAVMKHDITPFADHLLPIIILSMEDQTSRRKQEVAIKTLGQFVSGTGLVVIPFLQYPHLLPSTLDLVTRHGQSIPWSLRREALRTLGLLGSLDPYKYAIVQEHLERRKKKERSDSDTSGVIATGTTNLMLIDHARGPPIKAEVGHRKGKSFMLDSEASSQEKRRSGSMMTDEGGRTGRSESTADAPRGAPAQIHYVKSEVLLEEDNGELPAHRFMMDQCAERACFAPSNPVKERLTPQSEDFYPRSAIASLMKILHDNSLGVYHSAVTQAIMLIFKSLGMHCVPFLDEIIPFLLQVLRRCGPGLRESLLQQLSHLAAIVKYHLSRYLPQLFEIICEYWNENLHEVLYFQHNVCL